MTDFASSVVWIDVNGRTRQTIIQTLTGAAPITTVMQSFQLASIQRLWESAMVIPGTPPSAGNYQSNSSAAELLFQTGAGTIVRLVVPAPGISVFKADGVTIDPANVNIIALVAACTGLMTDGNGNAVTGYLGGRYKRGTGTDLDTP